LKSLPFIAPRLGAMTMSAFSSSYMFSRCPMIANDCSTVSSELTVACTSGCDEMFTAITKSAPISCAKRTGTGDTRPPSTYVCSPIRTDWNTPGTADDARTAMPVLPRLNRIG
jgi:hypothetical protein